MRCRCIAAMLGVVLTTIALPMYGARANTILVFG
jgi:hypothetical protein